MQKGGNVKNVKMFCALLASNDERTLHLLAPPGDNLRCALRANTCCPSHTQSLTHSFLALSGRAHLAVVRQSAAINTLTFDMFRCRKCQLQQLTRLSGCTHKVAASHAPFLPLHMPHLTWHFVQLVCVSINLLSLSLWHLASEAVKFCIN